MLTARFASGDLAMPSPGAVAECPVCAGAVTAKCGEVVTWHWAHVAHADCDWEPETEWHRNWKACFPPECREVALGGKRADVRLADGLVVEFQHSSISSREIASREAFYRRMVWVV